MHPVRMSHTGLPVPAAPHRSRIPSNHQCSARPSIAIKGAVSTNTSRCITTGTCATSGGIYREPMALSIVNVFARGAGTMCWGAQAHTDIGVYEPERFDGDPHQ